MYEHLLIAFRVVVTIIQMYLVDYYRSPIRNTSKPPALIQRSFKSSRLRPVVDEVIQAEDSTVILLISAW